MDGEREEILPFADRLGGGHGAQHHGFAERGENRAVGLAGDTPGFERQRLAAELGRYSLDIEHVVSFHPAAQCVSGVVSAGETGLRAVRGRLSGPSNDASAPDCAQGR